MKILGVVPARSGSKGVPNKNITDVGGKPLLAYTAEAAVASRMLTRSILSTDDETIAIVGREYGLEVPFLRPAELAQDDTPTIDVLVHLLAELDPDCEYDALCLLQPTSPLRDAQMIDAACEQFQQENADTLLSALPVPAHCHPDWTLIEDEAGNVSWYSGVESPIPRRQLLRPAYHREGSIYIARSSLIREKSTLYGKKISLFPVNPDNTVNIDSIEDLKRARALIKGGR